MYGEGGYIYILIACALRNGAWAIVGVGVLWAVVDGRNVVSQPMAIGADCC